MWVATGVSALAFSCSAHLVEDLVKGVDLHKGVDEHLEVGVRKGKLNTKKLVCKARGAGLVQQTGLAGSSATSVGNLLKETLS